jgi:hypothetical protein
MNCEAHQTMNPTNQIKTLRTNNHGQCFRWGGLDSYPLMQQWLSIFFFFYIIINTRVNYKSSEILKLITL